MYRIVVGGVDGNAVVSWLKDRAPGGISSKPTLTPEGLSFENGHYTEVQGTTPEGRLAVESFAAGLMAAGGVPWAKVYSPGEGGPSPAAEPATVRIAEPKTPDGHW